MKKLILILCSAMLVLGTMGSASAVPTTWTDYIDFEPDVLIPPTYGYYHDIGDGEDGFNYELFGEGDDTIDSINLSLEIYDDNKSSKVWNWSSFSYEVREDGDEAGAVTYLHWRLPSQEINYENGTGTATGNLAAELDLYDDGTLNVWVSATEGDFYLGSSTLTVNGDNGTAPVPEPSTIMLMGVGLLGLVGFSRRRFKRS